MSALDDFDPDEEKFREQERKWQDQQDLVQPRPTDSEQLEKQLEAAYNRSRTNARLRVGNPIRDFLDEAMQLIQQRDYQRLSAVDHFEVIDETRRAYVKGSIYGSPVKVELSYQNDGKTLKAFVTAALDPDNSKIEE